MTDWPETTFDTVCIDFDETLAKSLWPSNEIGDPIARGVEALLHYFDQGKEIIVYTARPASHAGLLWRWFTDHKLNHAIHDIVTGKPRAGLYIDDRAFNPFTVWPSSVPPEGVEEGDVIDSPHAPNHEELEDAFRPEDPRPELPVREPSAAVRDEQERRRLQRRAAEKDDDLAWEAMD